MFRQFVKHMSRNLKSTKRILILNNDIGKW